MQRICKLFSILTILLFAKSASAVPASICNFVIDFKATAYVQTATDVNTPPGSNVYKDVVTKVKLTTADLIEAIAHASSQPLPPAGTRLAIYTDGPNEGQACLLDLNNAPISGFAPISSGILALNDSEEVIERSWTDSPTGSTKDKYWQLVDFQMNFAPPDTLHIIAPIEGRYTEKFAPGGAITDVIRGTISGIGVLDDFPAFVTGKINGKLIVGVIP